MLESLRAKPNHVKQTISVVVTIVLFSVILFVWVSSRSAREGEMEVKRKTVSPVDGVTSMFDGFASEFKQKMSGLPSFGTMNSTPPVATSSPSDNFEISGVMIIDNSSTTKSH